MKNRKASLLAGALSGTILILSACADEESHEYAVRGPVKHRQIDYDCPGEDVALAPVAFAKTGGASGARSGGSGPSNSKPRVNRPADDAGDPSTGGGTRSRGTPAERRAVHPGGVKLDKKPKKPTKVADFTPSVHVAVPKGCATEYELFITADGALWEQDVRREDYVRCQEGETFPACTAENP